MTKLIKWRKVCLKSSTFLAHGVVAGLLWAFVLGGSIRAADAGNKILFQEDFETNPLSGGNDGWTAEGSGVSVDAAVFHEGAGALRLGAPDDKNIIRAFGPYFAYSGGKIKLGAWIKTENVVSDGVKPWDMAGLSVFYYDQEKKPINYLWKGYHNNLPTLDGTNDWTRQDATFDLPSGLGVAYARVGAELYHASGSFWIDDVTLTKLADVPWMTEEQAMPGTLKGQTELQGAISDLAAAIERARARAVDTSGAEVTQAVAQQVEKFIPDDIVAGKTGPFLPGDAADLKAKGISDVSYRPRGDNALYFHVYYRYVEGGPFALAQRELADAVRLCRDRIAELGTAGKGDGTLPVTSAVHVANGSFYNGKGEPIFGIGILFQPTDPALGANIVNLDEPSAREGTEDGKLSPEAQDRCRKKILGAMNYPNLMIDLLDTMMGEVPDWMKKSDPSILTHGNHFMPVDPDNPTVEKYNVLFNQDLAGMISALRDPARPPFFLYDLYNEPALLSSTTYTKAKYVQWLKEQYHNDVNRLNLLWQTHLASFDQAETGVGPSVAQRYDWQAFNEARGTEYFRKTAEAIRSRDPAALLHIKLMETYWEIPRANPAMGQGFLTAKHEDGLDWEELSKIEDVLGRDGWLTVHSDDYAYEWRSQGLALDFMKSVAPEKPILDSEWHFLTSDVGLVGDLVMNSNPPPGYVSSLLWHGYLHGMRASEAWLWGRYWNHLALTDDDIPHQFPHCFGLEPEATDTYLRTALTLRKLAPYVIPFAQQKGAIRILYSEPSMILSRATNLEIVRAYEGADFLNVPVRFITANQLAAGTDALKDGPVLLVPDDEYVSEPAYQAVLAFANGGGEVIISGDHALQYNERGEPRDLTALTKCPSLERISSGANRGEWRTQIDQAVSRAGIDRTIRVVDATGATPDKVESRTVPYDGKWLTYVLNLGPEPEKLSLVKAGLAVDQVNELISDTSCSGTGFDLPKWGVKLFLTK